MTGAPLKQQQQQSAAAAAAGGDSLQEVDEDQRVYLASAAARAGQLQPTCATVNPTILATNLLHEIDQAVQVRL